MKFLVKTILAAILISTALTAPEVVAAESVMDQDLRSKAKRATDEGLRFLREEQEENGSWMNSVGITAIALRASLESHRGYSEADGAFITRPIQFILSNVNEDGSITESIQNRNYNTATAITALQLSGNPAYADAIEGGQNFLKALQIDEGEGYDPDHPYYGGIGYGGDERPDLSNQYYALEALSTTGLDSGDPVWQKALIFLNRSQNRSESNDQAWAANDGGFTYMPGYSPHGGTGSYGGMTHVGLIGLLFAGVDRNDPRVQAAYDWIRENYTLDRNPGSKDQQGLYYYYTAFAKSMFAFGEPMVTDGDGAEHNWRNDLAAKLIALQGDDGAWVNDQPRWWEGLKPLVTARAIIALNFSVR